jgi:hypothetical protein
MFAKQGQLNFATRLTAISTLITWLSAIVFCSVECSTGSSHCGSSHCRPAAHHDTKASDHHHTDASHHEHHASCHDADRAHDSPSSPQPCSNSLCDSLKSITQTSFQANPMRPDFALAYVFAWTAPLETLTLPRLSSHFREAPEPKWVFTPEVCLGPAFRSLAPPSSARLIQPC